MERFYYPIEVMQLRDQQLQSNYSATFGTVRNNLTTNHQGGTFTHQWGPVLRSRIWGTLHGSEKQGAYGQQLALSFNRDGSNSSSDNPLIAFYYPLARWQYPGTTWSDYSRGSIRCPDGCQWERECQRPASHFEVRTTNAQAAGTGLTNRIDPGQILGYRLYNSEHVQIVVRRCSSRCPLCEEVQLQLSISPL